MKSKSNLSWLVSPPMTILLLVIGWLLGLSIKSCVQPVVIQKSNNQGQQQERLNLDEQVQEPELFNMPKTRETWKPAPV